LLPPPIAGKRMMLNLAVAVAASVAPRSAKEGKRHQICPFSGLGQGQEQGEVG